MDSHFDGVDEVGCEIINHAYTKPNGLTNADLADILPNSTSEEKIGAINKLLQKGIFEILKKQNNLIYRLKDLSKKGVPKGADNEEKIVYSIIEEGGNKGIWIRDIRVKSNLIMTQLNKILKNLENKKLIKAVKSVSASKKKVYMLYNLEPDRSITGGAWYQDQDFESEFVDVLNQQSLRYLQIRKDEAQKKHDSPRVALEAACCTVKDVHSYITELGISKVHLDEDDLETILKTVVYDGKADRVVQIDGSNLYRAIDLPLPPFGLVQMPCGVCPIMKNCSTFGEVTPKVCQYMTEWLE